MSTRTLGGHQEEPTRPWDADWLGATIWAGRTIRKQGNTGASERGALYRAPDLSLCVTSWRARALGEKHLLAQARVPLAGEEDSH